MANYPLEYGSHTDPDTADESKIPDSSPATQRYPLEWGAHLDEPEDDAPVAPVFTPVMPTLLGGAHPDTFPLGVSPPSSMSTDLTAVSWPGTDVASGIPATDEALRQNRTRLAQAALPIVQSSRGPAQGTRGIAPPTEPAPGSPAFEAAMNITVGRPLVLPIGSMVPDERSPTGYLMSPAPDLQPVAAAGRAAKAKIDAFIGAPYDLMVPGSADMSKAIYDEIKGAIGQGGTLDYQRQADPKRPASFLQLPQFRNVSNFNVGLYMQQASVPLWLTLRLAGEYARKHSSNYKASEPYGLDPRTRRFIEGGYKVGQSGAFNVVPETLKH